MLIKSNFEYVNQMCVNAIIPFEAQNYLSQMSDLDSEEINVSFHSL